MELESHSLFLYSGCSVLSSIGTPRSHSTNTNARRQLFAVKGMKSIKKTEKKCCLCKSEKERSIVPRTARVQMYKETGIRIPKNNRCCKSHLANKRFTPEVLKEKIILTEDTNMDSEEISEWIADLTGLAFKKGPLIDFEYNSDLTEEDYQILTGYSKVDFDVIMGYCKSLHSSINRSKRNAVAMLLIQLRLNLSQKMICLLFGIQKQERVSATLEAALSALEKDFIPKYLGLSHITREELLEKHSVPAFDKLLLSRVDDEEGAPLEDKRLQLIFDATYLYIQKPKDLEFQRRTYSQHKSRNLLKPMMVVTSTGYIVDATELYFADYGNNDASILNHMMKTTPLLNLFEIGDHAIVDRGFRDAVEQVEDFAIYTHMPELLPKTRKQFSAMEGNKSRKVTMIRWVVEAVNGRIKKKFKFMDATIQMSYVPKLGRLFKLCCALINRFSPPIFTPSEITEKLVNLAVRRSELDNRLRKNLEQDGLLTRKSCWTLVSHE